MGSWALYFLIKTNFKPLYRDLLVVLYNSGKQVLINPSQLYNVSGYFYLPNISIFGIIFAQFPYNLAYYIFYTLNFLLGVLYIREYDEILKLLNVQKRSHRFLFLIIISNGWLVLWNFVFNQSKIIICFIFLFVLRREMKFNLEKKEKNIKFYILNYSLLIFAIGFAPYLVFFLMVYFFQDIHNRELFKRVNFQKYCIFFVSFVIQNIFFIISPNLISNFLNGVTYAYSKGKIPEKGIVPIRLFYLREFVYVNARYSPMIALISILIILTITVILVLNKILKIEQKLSILALTYIVIDVYKGYVIYIILLPLILLSFVPYLNQKLEGVEFLKKNLYFLTGLISISGFYFMVMNKEIIFNILPFLHEFPLIIFIYLRWLILLSIMLISLIILNFKNKSSLIITRTEKFDR
jgi:hypothetical protein